MDNLSDMTIAINKGMKVAGATDMPGQVVKLEDRTNANQIFKVRVGQYLEF